jgi:hypothetical protein
MKHAQHKPASAPTASHEAQPAKPAHRPGRLSATPAWAQGRPPALQAQLTINQPGDRYEREADQVAEMVLRMPEPGVQRQPLEEEEEELQMKEAGPSPVPATAPPIVQSVIRTPGHPLDVGTRASMEPRFGADFGSVRVHTDAQAAESAQAINARAYTVGRDVVFGAGQYAPGTGAGRRLLAHELAHVVQQENSSVRTVQRDLKAYNKAKTETLPSGGVMSMSTTMMEMSAEAPGIRAALSNLIAKDKVKEVTSKSGNVSWFAAQHHKNAQLKEIRDALQAAGYAKADKLARAIYDIHGEFLYTQEKLTTIAPFYSRTTSLGEKIRTQKHRSMTEWEIRQARRVFGNNISYSKVTIAEGSISAQIGSAGNYARTVGNTIYFPPGGSRDMAFMIHELTHVWQYQTTGWTYAPKAIWAQISEGYSYTDSGQTAEQSLIAARNAGKTLYSYNKEQQGDILSDYYKRLQKGKSVAAWQPFVNDI